MIHTPTWRSWRRTSLASGLAVLAALTLWASPASAQADIVGFWNQPARGTVLGPGVARMFGFLEDSTERADGPTLVDYLGIPLNEEARARLRRRAARRARARVHAAPLAVLLLGPGEPPYRGAARLEPRCRLLHNRRHVPPRRPDDLDGRPAAPLASTPHPDGQAHTASGAPAAGLPVPFPSHPTGPIRNAILSSCTWDGPSTASL